MIVIFFFTNIIYYWMHTHASTESNYVNRNGGETEYKIKGLYWSREWYRKDLKPKVEILFYTIQDFSTIARDWVRGWNKDFLETSVTVVLVWWKIVVEEGKIKLQFLCETTCLLQSRMKSSVLRRIPLCRLEFLPKGSCEFRISTLPHFFVSEKFLK